MLAPPVRALGERSRRAAAGAASELRLRARRLAARAGEGRRRRDRRLPRRRHPARGRRRRARSGARCERAAAAGARRRALRRARRRRRAGASCARGAAIALVPSRSAETFGLAAAEAMAAGLPVAASRVGALPELRRARTRSSRPATPPRSPARSAGSPATARPASAGARAFAELCAPEVVAARARARVYEQAPRGDPRKLARVPTAQTSALITGLTGQDGSFLAELLLEKGYARQRARARRARRGRSARPSTCAGSVELVERRPARAGARCATAIERARRERDLPPRRALVRARLVGATRRDDRARSPARPPRSSRRCASSTADTRVFVAASGAIFGDARESPQSEDTPLPAAHALRDRQARRAPARRRAARARRPARELGRSSSTTSPSAAPSSS